MRAIEKLFVGLLLTSSAYAAEPPYRGQNKYDVMTEEMLSDQFTEAAGYMGSLRFKSAKDCKCTAATFRLPEDPGCFERYARLYDSDKRHVDFRIAFGYYHSADGRGAYDPFFREEFRSRMLTPCRPHTNIHLCGFRPLPTRNANVEVLEKVITTPSGLSKPVRITLTNSAISSDASQANPMLALYRTKDAERVFFDGLCNADAVFYAGHGRGGGGPDFAYPRFVDNDPAKDVDFKSYIKDPSNGVRRMQAALANCETPAKIISLFGCPKPIFAKTLEKYAPTTIYQMPAQSTWIQDWPYQLFGTINGLLGQFCEPELSKAINSPKIDPSGRMTFHYH